MPPDRKRKQAETSTASSGGSSADIAALSSSLGMSAEAVSAMLAAQGGGSSTRSRRAAAPATTSASSQSSAWADFMEESTDKPAVSKSLPQDSSSAKSADTKSSNDDPDDTQSAYVLPVAPVTLDFPGVLSQTGTMDSSLPGRAQKKKDQPVKKWDLDAPAIICRSLFSPRKIKFVATSSTSCHSLCIDTEGNAYTWGRNDFGQCGVPSEEFPHLLVPKKVEMDGFVGVGGAVGKSHSVLLDDEGRVWSCGFNKVGQCGVGLQAEFVKGWKRGLCGDEDGKKKGGEVDVKFVKASCGEHFTVLLCSSGHLHTTGSSEFGQLGNGETGEYFIAANKIGFSNCWLFLRRTTFLSSSQDKNQIPLNETICLSSIACGKNHTMAIEAPRQSGGIRRTFSFGCGAYGCLGHGIQKDSYYPKSIQEFENPAFTSNTPTTVACGTQHSLILTQRGHVYYCGKHKSAGEATMRPNIVNALASNGHDVLSLSGGNGTVFCSTKMGNTVSWGNASWGELGYGTDGGKSSAKPKFVPALDSCIVEQISCGYAHTVFVIREEDKEDKDATKKIDTLEAGDLEQHELFLKESCGELEIEKAKKKGARKKKN